MTELHDSEIVSYKVSLKTNEIVVQTEYTNSIIVRSADMIFTNVLVHYFEDELSGSIILDVEEYSIAQFIKDNAKLLEQRKNKCWPFDYDTIEHLNETLVNER